MICTPSTSLFIGEGNGTPLQYSCLENPMDGGAWKAAVHGVAEGRTRLSDFTFAFCDFPFSLHCTPARRPLCFPRAYQTFFYFRTFVCAILLPVMPSLNNHRHNSLTSLSSSLKTFFLNQNFHD